MIIDIPPFSLRSRATFIIRIRGYFGDKKTHKESLTEQGKHDEQLGRGPSGDNHSLTYCTNTKKKKRTHIVYDTIMVDCRSIRVSLLYVVVFTHCLEPYPSHDPKQLKYVITLPIEVLLYAHPPLHRLSDFAGCLLDLRLPHFVDAVEMRYSTVGPLDTEYYKFFFFFLHHVPVGCTKCPTLDIQSSGDV